MAQRVNDRVGMNPSDLRVSRFTCSTFTTLAVVLVSVLVPVIVPVIAIAQPNQVPLGVPASSVASLTPPPPQNHLAITGWISGGFLAAVGGSIQYQRGEIGDATWVIRGEGLGAVPLELVGPERLSFSLLGGGRAYRGVFYVDGELGVSIIRRGRYDDGIGDPSWIEYDVWPAGRLGVGLHGRGLDLGIALGVPAFGIGIHLGIDIGHW